MKLLGEQSGGQGGPLGFKGAAKGGSAGLAVPVGRVEGVAFLAVKVGVKERALGRVDVLGEVVGGVPVAVGVVPEGVEQRRE